MSKIKSVGRWFTKNAPTLLSITACVGTVATGVLTAMETPKAVAIYNEMHKGEEGKPSIQTLATSAVPYIPAICAGAVTIACILGANGIHLHREKNLIMASNMVSNYARRKGNSPVAAAAAMAGAKAITKEDVEKADNENLEWFYDDFSGTLFQSRWKDVLEAELKLNEEFNNCDGWHRYCGQAPLAIWYKELGIVPDCAYIANSQKEFYLGSANYGIMKDVYGKDFDKTIYEINHSLDTDFLNLLVWDVDIMTDSQGYGSNITFENCEANEYVKGWNSAADKMNNNYSNQLDAKYKGKNIDARKKEWEEMTDKLVDIEYLKVQKRIIGESECMKLIDKYGLQNYSESAKDNYEAYQEGKKMIEDAIKEFEKLGYKYE